MGDGLTLTEQLLPHAGPDAPAVADGDWEVGRLVLADGYRTDVDALRHCLHAALVHAFRHAHVSRLFATCTDVLGRLYRRFAFTPFARDVPLADTGKVYTMISGGAQPVSRALSGRPVPQAH